MQPIYLAANVTDAQLVANLLHEAGVEAFVRGADLQGGLGDLPVTGSIAVCVGGEDVPRAREVLAQWERGDFALPDEAGPAAEPAIPLPQLRRGISPLLTFFIGGAIGALLVWLGTTGPTQTTDVDYDEDGIVDERAFATSAGVERVESDRNEDGRIDAIIHYDGMAAARGQSDDDFDGRMETKLRFRRNQWAESESDWDGDGAIDHRIEANAGVIGREQWLDASGTVLKQVLWERGRPRTSELDRDGDGRFEQVRTLDAIQEADSKVRSP